ncbi:TPA: hypothetical protein OEK08_003969 [Escherichia coli]|uniref:hypothetical protein n=1 Tax=Escherichia coli TaxID=562 RepID=UPI000B7CE2B1|nr:hypothetical protein [Escherichia coli]EFE7183773.1 hypothetical protein [Escherichia coli]EFH9434139.1 hypothetical protein [Escherichia coli]EGI1153968.1 hypothetical protein [Escherichia coli]EGI1155628.1 hypothetical protein [Escherichia coli]EHM6217427.1 hypothetical protein [Escherichia coli]
MTTITKERLQWLANISGRDDIDDIDGGEIRELAFIALASLEAEPVLYQSCTRPTWNSGVPWTEWKERSRECYEDDLRFTDTPDHAGWIYKCRKLYTTPPAPIALEAIENAIEYIRSIAFHIDEDDYHGKHIAHYMQQALAWLEGHSCSADSQDKSDNSPLPRYQVIELTMLVKQLVSQLKKAKPDCKLPDRAMDYLLRNGLVSAEGVLR